MIRPGCRAGAPPAEPIIAATDAVALQLLVVEIRPATHADRDVIWKIFHEVIAAGDTYPLDRDTSRDEALAYWFQRGAHVYIAELDCLKQSSFQTDQRVVGTDILKPNQSGGGAHVANAAFMVPKSARGQGVGRAMGEHCFAEARRLGFRAMQFNFVVSTNELAVKLWQDLGMKIVATLPGAFRHPEKGYVDVYVMFRSLLPAKYANSHE
jgi:ribosomal protein S18 acetylase RimI-like enzyme